MGYDSVRPAAIGEAMAHGPGLVSDGRDGATRMEPRPRDQFQPRLGAGLTCLLVTFVNWCDFSELIRLWER
jgi:hypothetical protein